MSYRIEEKIVISNSEFYSLKQYFLNLNVKRIFSKRQITSVYFDNFHMDLFNLSEEGVVPRKKIRMRFYENDNSKNCNLETKSHLYDGRKKNVIKITKNKFDFNLKFGIYDNEYGQLLPKVIIKYQREYYYFKDVRITLDNQIFYSKIVNPEIFLKDQFSVIELKPLHSLLDINAIEEFSFPKERFSKYCRAINFLYN